MSNVQTEQTAEELVPSPSWMAADDPAHASRHRPGARRWIAPAAILAITLIPLVAWWLQREVALWYAAASFEATLNHDQDASLQFAKQAVAWSPTDFSLRGELVDRLMRLRKVDAAIKEADVSLRMARTAFVDGGSVSARADLATSLNQSAYVRAVAGRDLDQAQKQIDEAITLLENVEVVPGALRDTRGYIAYLRNDMNMSLLEMELAVEQVEPEILAIRDALRESRPGLIDERGCVWLMKEQDQHLAVLLQHRGLVYERLGRKADAAGDLKRAKELGYDPQAGVW